ncbi:MAG: hypothetical protein IT327_28665 [Anaerolineae bacterium]|nr:hypothetical protein [Anaerolineae bacterium]
MGSQDTFNLGDKVWYEAEDGNRYLMVVKEISSGGNTVSLYPFDSTSMLLKDESESKYTFIYKSNVRPATVVKEGNLTKAKRVAEHAVNRAVRAAEQKGHALSYPQKNFISQAIIHGYLEMKQDFELLEESGFFERM